MNIIPSIFNQKKISYTVLGGAENPSKVLMNVTCVVLCENGNMLRSRVLENLLAKGFERIILIERKAPGVSAQQLSHQFPTVRFLFILEEGVTSGEMLNIAVAESESKYILVVHEEMCAENFGFDAHTAKRLSEKNVFCVVPRLFSNAMQKLPVEFEPSAENSIFKVEILNGSKDYRPTLYSASLAGFYDREKIIMLGGFDYTITSEYWQKLDFFFRSWLWGEQTLIANCFDLFYMDQIPDEDQSADISYLRFYLKNLLPVFVADHGKIPSSSFLAFKAHSSCGFVESLRQFRDACRWTEKNKYRFKTDAVNFMQNWNQNEADKF